MSVRAFLFAAVAAATISGPALAGDGHADLVRDVRELVLSGRMAVGDSAPDFSAITTAAVREGAMDGYKFDDGRIALATIPAKTTVVPVRPDGRGHHAAFRVTLPGIATAACADLVTGVADLIGQGEIVVDGIATGPKDVSASRVCKAKSGAVSVSIVVE